LRDRLGVNLAWGGDSRILDNGTDIDPSMTPYEAGLGAYVHLDKGDFIGRDALQNASREPLLLGLKCEKTVPLVGLEVYDADEAVAQMTIGAWSPYLDCGIGYVRFREPGKWVGRELTLRNNEWKFSSLRDRRPTVLRCRKAHSARAGSQNSVGARSAHSLLVLRKSPIRICLPNPVPFMSRSSVSGSG
jgi:hypothetical protein